MAKVGAGAGAEEAEDLVGGTGEEEAEELVGTGAAGGVAVLEVATIAVEAAQWEEVVHPAVVLVDAVGATSVSGRRTSERSTLLSARRKRTGWSPGSKLPKTRNLSSPFVRFFYPTQTVIFTGSSLRSWMGDTW